MKKKKNKKSKNQVTNSRSKTRKKRDERAKDILVGILNGVDSLISPFFNPCEWRYGGGLQTLKADRERYYEWVTYQRLKKKKLIKEKKKGTKVVLELTEEGKLAALKARIIRTEKELPKGKFCLVSYDIPEHQSSARRAIRRLLKMADFRKRHHSTWLTRKDVVSDMRKLIKKLKIKDWMEAYIVEKK